MHRKEFFSPHIFMTTQVYRPASTFLTLFIFNHLYILTFILLWSDGRIVLLSFFRWYENSSPASSSYSFLLILWRFSLSHGEIYPTSTSLYFFSLECLSKRLPRIFLQNKRHKIVDLVIWLWWGTYVRVHKGASKQNSSRHTCSWQHRCIGRHHLSGLSLSLTICKS